MAFGPTVWYASSCSYPSLLQTKTWLISNKIIWLKKNIVRRCWRFCSSLGTWRTEAKDGAKCNSYCIILVVRKMFKPIDSTPFSVIKSTKKTGIFFYREIMLVTGNCYMVLSNRGENYHMPWWNILVNTTAIKIKIKRLTSLNKSGSLLVPTIYRFLSKMVPNLVVTKVSSSISVCNIASFLFQTVMSIIKISWCDWR